MAQRAARPAQRVARPAEPAQAGDPRTVRPCCRVMVTSSLARLAPSKASPTGVPITRASQRAWAWRPQAAIGNPVQAGQRAALGRDALVCCDLAVIAGGAG